MVRRNPFAVVFLAFALLGAGCSKTGGGSAAGSPSASPTPVPTAESPAPSPSESPSKSPASSPTRSPELEDGRHFGYIQSVDVTTIPYTMVFDLAYFLTGDEAIAAAKEHGDLEDGFLPNDYYIVNDNPRLRTLSFGPDVTIAIVNWESCCESTPGVLGPFVEAFRRHHAPPGNYKGSFSQYWLTVEGGEVVSIEEQYLP